MGGVNSQGEMHTHTHMLANTVPLCREAHSMHVAALLRHAVSRVGFVLPAAHNSLGTGRRKQRERAALVGGSNTLITPMTPNQ